MPRVIIAIDGLMTREVLLTKEYTSVGRRPYNDIVIDNLAVSGEHAVLHLQGGEVAIEDLGSTNGTYVNGKPVRRSPLHHGDTVQVGKFTLRLLEDNNPTPLRPSTMAPLPEPLPTASVRVLSGAAAGREMVLQKSSPRWASRAWPWPPSRAAPRASCSPTWTAPRRPAQRHPHRQRASAAAQRRPNRARGHEDGVRAALTAPQPECGIAKMATAAHFLPAARQRTFPCDKIVISASAGFDAGQSRPRAAQQNHR